ncbi:hypothetical protein [Amycolatopsis jejuensis]|uniref:hypothetical protein n=1 Tax=Amycolatopsis jejuensis TaxID=330084 RepID=UPI000AB9EB05|nr:hypothetical protein [Amycolatopsis jejuensis]
MTDPSGIEEVRSVVGAEVLAADLAALEAAYADYRRGISVQAEFVRDLEDDR